MAISTMNSDQLALFLHVARSGNLSRSAHENGVSQSSLSRKIAALEKELHTRLFHRSGRGVTLTESGQRLEKYAREVSILLENAAREMSEAMGHGPSKVVIAAPPAIGKLVFGAVGKALKKSYPGIRVHFKEGLGGVIPDWLANGEIDAAVIYVPEHNPMFKVDILLRDRLNLVAPVRYRGLGKSFPVRRLHEVPLVIPSLPNSLRVLLDSLAARHSKALNVSMECDASVGLMKQLVLEDCGCTILPMPAVHDEVKLGLLQAVPLVEPEVARDVAIVTSRNRPPILHQRRVIEAMREVILSLVADGRWVDAVLLR